jgi:phosphatidylinositol-3-phosphatase
MDSAMCRRSVAAASLIIACIVSSGRVSATPAPPQSPGSALPRPAHVVIVIEENRSAPDIVGNEKLPNIQQLIAQGALFNNSRAITHPSLPNYFALFAGMTNQDGDHCSDKPIDAAGDLPVPAGLSARMPTLASELVAAQHTFTGFAESLPQPGYVGCYGRGGPLFSAYFKRHVPWAFFTRAGHTGEAQADTNHYVLDDAVNQPWDAFPSQGQYEKLPTVSMVVPNLRNDMHGTAIGETPDQLEKRADEWLGRNIMPLVAWAEDPRNNTLVIITWDESDRLAGRPDTNSIATIFAGAMIRHGSYSQVITHYNVLATIEDFYRLPRLGNSASVDAIANCWIEDTAGPIRPPSKL